MIKTPGVKYGHAIVGGEQIHGAFDTEEEAAREGFNCHNVDTVEVAVLRKPLLSECVSVYDLLESAGEGASVSFWYDHDWCPEMHSTPLARQELADLIDIWATKHDLHPDFWIAVTTRIWTQEDS